MKAQFVKPSQTKKGLTLIFEVPCKPEDIRDRIIESSKFYGEEIDIKVAEKRDDSIAYDPLSAFIVQNAAEYARNLKEACRIMSEVREKTLGLLKEEA